MDNQTIADSFLLLSKLLEIHGENSFRARSYSAAAFAAERYQAQLSHLTQPEIAAIKGIGASTAKKIIEMIETGRLKILDELIAQTPEGVLEMMKIKGIGPKRIHTIWKEMGIESLGELLYACQENRLKLFKGFGAKTQVSIEESINFYFKNQGKFLYAQVEEIVPEIKKKLSDEFGVDKIIITGEYARQCEILDLLAFIVLAPVKKVTDSLVNNLHWKIINTDDGILVETIYSLKVKIYPCLQEEAGWMKITKSSSPEFLSHFLREVNNRPLQKNLSVKEIFNALKWPDIPAYLREIPGIEKKYTDNSPILQTNQIKGIIHSHTDWSDGSNTIDEMANACIEKGMEYVVISDHSKSAFYANGLKEDRIILQHNYIDKLNKQLKDFTIYKGIESDILHDGSLDYSNDILSSFDVVIASVHSTLNMDEATANTRLLKAIENPYTTILGHPTGRLLLSRKGYPLNFKKVIDACIANGVVIELNANPRRLDIDWRHIEYILEKGGIISINPDAHSIAGLNDIRYGVLAAQKAMVTPEKNLSSFSRDEFSIWLSNKHGRK